MPRNRLELNVSSVEKKELEKMISQSGKDPKMALRCKIILMTDQGIPLLGIVEHLDLSKTTVNAWRQVFKKDRLRGLKERRPVGRPRKDKSKVVTKSIRSQKRKTPGYIIEPYL